MTTIGTFTKTDNGFTGHIETLTLSAPIRFEPAEKLGDKSPNYRVFARNAEIGAAWIKISRKDTPYLAVTLDDPTFKAPIQCRLFEGEDGEFRLLWNR